MSLEVSKLAALAQDISSQEDYERVILENGLQSNAPHCKKSRQFILALVNGDDERPFERTAQFSEDFVEPDEQAEDEPEEEDYVISSAGRLGGQTQVSQVGGKVLGTVTEYDDAIRLISKDMEKNQFWPNVWTVSDHGNASLVTDFDNASYGLSGGADEDDDASVTASKTAQEEEFDNSGEVDTGFNWDSIKKEMEKQPWSMAPESDDAAMRAVYLGQMINPSGKYYMPWTTNQTDEDVDVDTAFWEKMNEEAEAAGYSMTSGEGDPTDSYVAEYKMLDEFTDKEREALENGEEIFEGQFEGEEDEDLV